MTVMGILHQKHPSLHTPNAYSLMACDFLLLLKDVEITGSYILFVVIIFRAVQFLGAMMLTTEGVCYFVLVLTAQDFVMLLPLLHKNC